jgi:ATP-dependent DNA helicase RecG
MNIVKQESIESPLPKLIEKVKDVVQSQLRTFTALNPLTGKFVSVPEYPTFAWQEGIINAITHRSYSMQGEDIRVFMFDDRLEILSPGKFPKIVNKYNIREVRYSRNPRIARALTELGWVRELGEGVKRIFEEMKLFFLDEPIYEEPNYSVLLTLKNNIITRRQRRVERISTLISKEWNNLSNEEKRALEMAYGKDKLTTREFADSISRSANYSRNILNGLVDKGFLHKIASSKTDPNQYFELVDYNEE